MTGIRLPLALTGEGGFLPGTIKAVLERGLQAEPTEHLGYEKHERAGRSGVNARNGTTANTLGTEVGDVALIRDSLGAVADVSTWPTAPIIVTAAIASGSGVTATAEH